MHACMLGKPVVCIIHVTLRDKQTWEGTLQKIKRLPKSYKAQMNDTDSIFVTDA